MKNSESTAYIDAYHAYLTNKEFPCVAARAALTRQQIRCLVVDHMACPKDDAAILQFIYDFVAEYRPATELFHSAAVIFKGPVQLDEAWFDELLWQRLQALADLDARQYGYDPRVAADPEAGNFSFSLKEEAFFVIGLHPASSRPARQFQYPTLVFNPHAQFEELRARESYGKMKAVIRKRDLAYSGSVNPMLTDFGNLSEVYQYSGRQYDQQWKCPLKIKHGALKHHPAA